MLTDLQFVAGHDRRQCPSWISAIRSPGRGRFREGVYSPHLVLMITDTSQVPANVSPDQAASIPACLATAAIGLFHKENPDGSAALYPPWEDGGIGKYKSEPIFVPGGASTVGQFGGSRSKHTTFCLVHLEHICQSFS